MKKICYLFCFCVLISCSKKSDISPNDDTTLITYSFKSSISGSYDLYYISPHNLSAIQVQVTGSAWSKTDTISNANSYPSGYGFPLVLGITSEVSGATYTLTISINNHVESTGNFSPTDPYGAIDYNYVILH